MVGLVSSLLAVIGLWRAAERLDPVTREVAGQYYVLQRSDGPSQSCALPCIYSPEPRSDGQA